MGHRFPPALPGLAVLLLLVACGREDPAGPGPGEDPPPLPEGFAGCVDPAAALPASIPFAPAIVALEADPASGFAVAWLESGELAGMELLPDEGMREIGRLAAGPPARFRLALLGDRVLWLDHGGDLRSTTLDPATGFAAVDSLPLAPGMTHLAGAGGRAFVSNGHSSYQGLRPEGAGWSLEAPVDFAPLGTAGALLYWDPPYLHVYGNQDGAVFEPGGASPGTRVADGLLGLNASSQIRGGLAVASGEFTPPKQPTWSFARVWSFHGPAGWRAEFNHETYREQDARYSEIALDGEFVHAVRRGPYDQVVGLESWSMGEGGMRPAGFRPGVLQPLAAAGALFQWRGNALERLPRVPPAGEMPVASVPGVWSSQVAASRTRLVVTVRNTVHVHELLEDGSIGRSTVAGGLDYEGFAAAGELAVGIVQRGTSLDVLDLRDMGSAGWVGKVEFGSTPGLVAMRPGWAFVFLGLQNAYAVDLSAPSEPLSHFFWLPRGDAVSMHVEGDDLFLATSSGSIERFDISRPATPVFVARQELGAVDPRRLVAGEDGLYLLTADPGELLHSPWPAPGEASQFGAPFQLAGWDGPPRAVVHAGHFYAHDGVLDLLVWPLEGGLPVGDPVGRLASGWRGALHEAENRIYGIAGDRCLQLVPFCGP